MEINIEYKFTVKWSVKGLGMFQILIEVVETIDNGFTNDGRVCIFVS